MEQEIPTYGTNFLLSFDYQLPPLSKKIKNILYIHSTRMEQSATALKRLTELFKDANIFLLKQNDVSAKNFNYKFSGVFNFSEKKISPSFYKTEEGKALASQKIDLVFFCINFDVKLNDIVLSNSQITCHYDNLLELLKNLDLYDWTAAIDKQYCVYYPWQLEEDRVRRCDPLKIDGTTMYLPWTLLFPSEKETLFDLGKSGPSEGAIINIGHYLGGSPIILAKGSKLANREKVFSYDVQEYPDSQDIIIKNDLDDWIFFKKESSKEAARNWSNQRNKSIRLLFIDGDHSYEGCKNDILLWSEYLVPGGIIAIHDYGNASDGEKFSSVVKAVYDTILSNEQFHKYRRCDTLFLASKK